MDGERGPSMEKTTTISCLCGAAALELTGAPIVQLYCHCDDCQAVHGAAYVPAAIYPTAATRLLTGDLLLWRRKTTIRATCRGCGTRLYAEPATAPIRSVPAHLLPAGTFEPDFHMHCRFALLPVTDDLPHYAGEPAMLGGDDAQVAW
jgi:hypothetical protein